jgi:hypothetical protein
MRYLILYEVEYCLVYSYVNNCTNYIFVFISKRVLYCCYRVSTECMLYCCYRVSTECMLYCCYRLSTQLRLYIHIYIINMLLVRHSNKIPRKSVFDSCLCPGSRLIVTLFVLLKFSPISHKVT